MLNNLLSKLITGGILSCVVVVFYYLGIVVTTFTILFLMVGLLTDRCARLEKSVGLILEVLSAHEARTQDGSKDSKEAKVKL